MNDQERESTEAQASPQEGADRPGGLLAAAGRMFGFTGPITLPLRGLSRSFAALAHPDYRLLWTGAMFSNIGAWMQNVAKSWLVYEISGSAFWLGVDAFVTHFSAVLLLPLGGALADRFERRRLLIVCNALLAVLALLLGGLYAGSWLRVSHVIVVSALSGILQAVMTPAYQSLLPDLIPPQHMANAVALNSLQFNLSRALGPAIGGLVMVRFGATWSFVFNAVSFLAVIGACMVIQPRSEGVPRQPESIVRSMSGGASYLRGRGDLAVFLTLVILLGFFGAPVNSMLPALADDAFGGDETVYSLLLSAFGVGAMIGAMLMAAGSHRGPTPWRAFPVLVVSGLAQLLVGVQAWLAVTLTLMMLLGIMHVGVMNRLNAAILASVPPSMRGRMSSFFVLAFRLGIPLGSLAAGSLADVLTVQHVFGAFGLLLMVSVGVLQLESRRRGVTYRGVEAAQEAMA
jgi:predicted MFS family arabinose efflux permease